MSDTEVPENLNQRGESTVITVCKSIAMFAAKIFATGIDRTRKPSHGTAPLLMVVALAAMIAPLWGCGDGAGGGSGEGTIDISKSKAIADSSNEKGAALRGAGGIQGDALKGKKSGKK